MQTLGSVYIQRKELILEYFWNRGYNKVYRIGIKKLSLSVETNKKSPFFFQDKKDYRAISE